ncbi:nitrite reductase/ring-hydroxylating ferredoxin subunit [Variovorax sp. TBS-050B]|uniref:Rieske 2Fe-2S domain-containing protein n=1 Tax=Variovorax sp. TBS-050B TaxID=2940551 RepID=UPI0024758214|nr:Rieske 2Fe-2S domain-containing protein [Variovorax sp. TBS-050B]MDH6595194.1 nitrite reductase/ring-hydroxylating ferredoxin subunit [Variovorax sp. TBS-050B]
MQTDFSPDWHPVAPSAGLHAGANIVAGFAAGQELALWRAADGRAQAWENRCPHRSVRFTLGTVAGDQLACAYHGWQYAAGSGQCTRIPAHPAMQVPQSVCAKVFDVSEAAGMLWVRLAASGTADVPRDDAVPSGWSFGRTLSVRADLAQVRDALAARGFATQGSHAALRGRLGGVDTVALLLDARPQLAFLHLWTEATPGSAAMATLHRAARELRAAVEALQPPQAAP